jgi:hypothetical protein
VKICVICGFFYWPGLKEGLGKLMRLEYEPRSGAILMALFLATSLSKESKIKSPLLKISKGLFLFYSLFEDY